MNDCIADHRLEASPIAAYLVGAAVFVFWKIDLLWSGSVDVANHVVLATRLMDDFGVHSDPTLFEMATYPRYAHAIAAAVGLVLNSATLGIQVTILVALLVGWTALLVPGRTLPPRIAALQAIIFILVFLLNDAFLHIELFGQEIIGNFFFAQFVAQALAFAVLAVYIKLETCDAAPWFKYVFVGLAVQAIARFHLLAAVELLGFLGVAIILDLVVCDRERRSAQLVSAALIGLLSVTALVTSGVFRAMVTISENNGSLDFSFLHNTRAVLIFAILAGVIFWAVLIVGPVTSRGWGRALVYPRVIATFGLGASMLCVLQYIVVMHGSGSEYAVKKYVFTICTMLFVLLSVGAAFVVDGALRGAVSGPWLTRIARFAICGCPLMLLLAPSFGTAYTYAQTSRIAQVERFARLYRAAVLGDPAPKHDAAIDIWGIHPTGDYLISLADLHMPRGENASAILDGRPPPHPADLRYIITSAEPSFWSTPKCRRFSGVEDLVVVEMSCLLSMQPECANWDFAESDAISPYVSSGFSQNEPDGRWNDGLLASIVCTISAKQRDARALRASTSAFVVRGMQRMAVDVDGQHVLSVTYDKDHAAREIEIPLPPAALAQQKLRIDFHFPDAVSPYELGLSGDKRRLAVKFHQFIFE